MERYDYMTAICDDLREYIRENIDLEKWRGNRDGLEEHLNDSCWIADSVTGNASGSYTFCAWEAEENLCHNMDLLEEALEEFGQSLGHAVERGAEYCDVTIRCYLLGQAIAEVLEEFAEELEEVEEEEDE